MKMPELTSKVVEFMKTNDGVHTYKELAEAVGTQPRGMITIRKSMTRYGFESLANRVVRHKEKYPRRQTPVVSEGVQS